MPSLRELGERQAIARLIAARPLPAGVVVGPGDDAAVLAPAAGMELVATADAFVEGRHFLPDWATPRQRGARLAAANLSDLAAMGGKPRWALLSMGLRPDHDLDELLAFQVGVARRLEPWDAAIVGGNLAAVEGPEWFDLALLGEAAAGRAWTRSGARAGDLVALTGYPGRAAAGLALARRLGPGARSKEWGALIRAWVEPDPPVALALELAVGGGVRAATDVSDGLAAALGDLARASGVGAEIEKEALLRDPELERAAALLGRTPLTLQLGPSDDYALLLAVSPAAIAACVGAAARQRVPLGVIGRFTEAVGVRLLAEGGARPVTTAGFDPFAPPA
jgi:thiamine-monophosphate kinase